jgi:DNA primase
MRLTSQLKVDIPRVVAALELSPELMGKELVCQCPFHHEHGNPNLEINSETGLWLCWVCGQKGNLAQLIQDLRSVSYREAVHFLEEYSDVPTIEEIKSRNLRELEQILKPPTNKTYPAVDITSYLHGRSWWRHIRHFDDQTIRKFSLGYDSARHRAIIPVCYFGKWIGIIRRATSDRQVPRYLYNSSFPKSDLLYAWDYVFDETNRCVLVEGPTDSIRGHSFGFTNTMAILGTSISARQQQLISDRFDEVVLFMDNDPAGAIASLRNAEQLSYSMSKVLVVTYDEIQRKDPDELTGTEWLQVLDNPTHWSALFA